MMAGKSKVTTAEKLAELERQIGACHTALMAARSLTDAIDACRKEGGPVPWGKVCLAHDALKRVL